MKNGLDLLKQAVETANTWLTSYVEMMEELSESHLSALYPSF
jgi:hypothetical protein